MATHTDCIRPPSSPESETAIKLPGNPRAPLKLTARASQSSVSRMGAAVAAMLDTLAKTIRPGGPR